MTEIILKKVVVVRATHMFGESGKKKKEMLQRQ